MGQVRGSRWTFGVAHPVGLVSSCSAALLVLLLALTGPVSQHRHGNPHHENCNSHRSNKTGRRAQIELPFYHHHVVLLLFLGFPLPFVFRPVFWAEGVLAPVHAQQATCGYHGGDWTAGLSLNLAGHRREKRERECRVNDLHDKKVQTFKAAELICSFHQEITHLIQIYNTYKAGLSTRQSFQPPLRDHDAPKFIVWQLVM